MALFREIDGFVGSALGLGDPLLLLPIVSRVVASSPVLTIADDAALCRKKTPVVFSFSKGASFIKVKVVVALALSQSVMKISLSTSARGVDTEMSA